MKKFVVKNKADFAGLLIYFMGTVKSWVDKQDFLKPFTVTIEEYKEKKSYPQLQGFYRIARNLVPYFKEWTHEYWDEEKIKEFIKKRYGYTVCFKGVQVCKSFKDATKEDMIGIIKEIQKFGDEMDLPKEVTELDNDEITKLNNINK